MATKKPKEHGILSRDQWPNYIGGMITETAFILGLSGFALLLAFIAKAVWR